MPTRSAKNPPIQFMENSDYESSTIVDGQPLWITTDPETGQRIRETVDGEEVFVGLADDYGKFPRLGPRQTIRPEFKEDQTIKVFVDENGKEYVEEVEPSENEEFNELYNKYHDFDLETEQANGRENRDGDPTDHQIEVMQDKAREFNRLKPIKFK